MRRIERVEKVAQRDRVIRGRPVIGEVQHAVILEGDVRDIRAAEQRGGVRGDDLVGARLDDGAAHAGQGVAGGIELLHER
jgi:hypothetical protein